MTMTKLERPTKPCLGVGNGLTVGFTCFWLRSRHFSEEVFLVFAIFAFISISQAGTGGL